MAQVNGFDFSKYDVGGSGATAGDGRLTGAEVAKAKADGWTIWDGCSKDDKIEKYKEKPLQISNKSGKQIISSEWWNKASKTLWNFTTMLNSSSYKEYKNLAKQKFAENLKNGMDMNQAMDKAKKDALKKLGLSENAFNGHWKYAKLLNYFENNDSTYISKSALKKAGEWINKKQAI